MAETDTDAPIAFSSDLVQDRLHRWWEGLTDRRGERAELRRCKTVDEVLLTEAYHRLRKQLTALGFVPSSEGQLGAVAGLLAHLDEEVPEQPQVGTQMAGGSAETDAPLSGRRFRRLLAREDRETLYRPLIRAVRLLGRRAHVGALARDLYYWGPEVRRRWALHYYEHALEEV